MFSWMKTKVDGQPFINQVPIININLSVKPYEKPIRNLKEMSTLLIVVHI